MFLFILLCLHVSSGNTVKQKLSTVKVKPMLTYTFNVHTGDRAVAGTTNCIFVRIHGSKGSSENSNLNGCSDLRRGSARQFQLNVTSSVGVPLVMEVRSKPFLAMDNQWFCDRISVTTPEGDAYVFPSYRWLDSHTRLTLRSATAKLKFNDASLVTYNQRRNQLRESRKQFRWCVYLEDYPQTICAETAWDLPIEIQFTPTKTTKLFTTRLEQLAMFKQKGLADSARKWNSFLELEKMVPERKGHIYEYVQKHWDKDEFFGYQFLNGINPMLIQRCSDLPENFPVTEEMVKHSLNGSTLKEAMMEGNIFLVDYKMLDGLKGNVIHGRQQYVAAPLVLLYCSPEKLMLPTAIQLMQEAGKENPIFLPTDSEHDWLLAKVYVRNADLLVQVFDSHITRTHTLAEVFGMATLRILPTVHPLYKLLIPHTRDTFNANVFLRQRLLVDGGDIEVIAGLNGVSWRKLMKRAASSLTYCSLCLPDDISERGLEDVPNYYYRDDGMKLWDIIHKFVKGVLENYYTSDDYVRKDTELQRWISEIYAKGFQESTSTVPKSFKTVTALVKFVTMVIFTTSGQHAAVHSGLMDLVGWMPNAPTSLSEPPPKVKGQTTEDSILKSLPDQASTATSLLVLELLKDHADPPLGYFPEEWFGEEVPRKLIKNFQKDLHVFSDHIEKRNAKLKLPYTYLNPKNIKNSVSI
ncbi:polyunsaturated fatty acid lipoxygenase ALOX15B-like [Sardina pilchardus]|uniref:polyunsaturated fatty acid lipoxygenase ALOX15B-like n=1 Tax=Sardina pilchardus TaxID=27697 RepID=UPI002E161E2E